MHTFRTTLISSRFSLGIFVFMLTCSLFDTSYTSSRKIPPSDVIELIRKYRAAQDTTGEERAARALAYHDRYINEDTSIDSINYDLIKEDLSMYPEYRAAQNTIDYRQGLMDRF